MKTEFLQIHVSTSDQTEAEHLIKRLSAKKIVACAQVQGPKALTAEEERARNEPRRWRCKFKTTSDLFPAVESELNAFFGDQPPDTKVLPIVKGSDSFLEWLGERLGKASSVS
jgi:periplasmic divalent cation tolerance protein